MSTLTIELPAGVSAEEAKFLMAVMADVVTNSSCLIGLERIQRLELLSQVFTSIVIPEAVQQEKGYLEGTAN